MNCIAIDTTNSNLSIALIKGEQVFCSTKEIGKSGHSSCLMPLVDDMLTSHGVDISDIDTVAVVVGPGSFTGIRIGVSAMTAIAYAQNAKRVSVTSFDLIAYNRDKVLAGVDAGHGNLYVAKCDNSNVLDAWFVEAKDAKNLDAVVFDTLENPAQTLAKVVQNKVDSGNFVSVFEPYYMRKSQAEREKDEV